MGNSNNPDDDRSDLIGNILIVVGGVTPYSRNTCNNVVSLTFGGVLKKCKIYMKSLMLIIIIFFTEFSEYLPYWEAEFDFYLPLLDLGIGYFCLRNIL